MKMLSSILSNSIKVMVLILLGKILAFLKDVALSAYFGTSYQTDAYFVASNVPALMFTAFLSSVSIVFLPIYNRIRLENGQQASDEFASNTIGVYVTVSLCLSVVGILIAPQIVQVMAPAFEAQRLQLAINLTRIFCCSFAFSITTGLLSSIQYARKRFIGPQLIPPINNFITTVCILCFTARFGIYAAAVSATLGWAAQIPIQRAFLGNTFSYRFRFNWRDPLLKKMGWLFLPVLIGVSIDQINVLVDNILGSPLAVGSISALNYSRRLISVVSGIFVMGLATVMYPVFSEFVINKDYLLLSRAVRRCVGTLLLLIAPVAVIALVFDTEIVSLAFGRGSFDDAAIRLTSSAFFYYSIGIMFCAVRDILNRVFYSLEDTRTPLKASAVAVTINVGLSLLLVKRMGIGGLALATSISSLIYCVIQCVVLKKRIGGEFYNGLGVLLAKLMASTAGMVLIIFICQSVLSSESAVVSLAITCSAGILTYVGLAIVLRIEEVSVALKLLTQRFSRAQD